MKVVLIGDQDSPQRNFIASILDFHPRIEVTNFILSIAINSSSIIQHLADCFIYVDRMPNQSLIDKLDRGCPLVLVADRDYHSQLFIQFDDFVTGFAKALETFVENIDSLALLYAMENDFLPLVVPDTAIQQLRGNINYAIPQTIKHLKVAKRPWENLNKTQTRVASAFYYGTLNGLSKKQQHEQLGFSNKYYYDVLGELRDFFFVKTYPLLFQKLQEAVAQGRLNL